MITGNESFTVCGAVEEFGIFLFLSYLDMNLLVCFGPFSCLQVCLNLMAQTDGQTSPSGLFERAELIVPSITAHHSGQQVITLQPVCR